MEVAPEFWQNPEVLKELYVSTSGGAAAARSSPRPVAGTTSPQIRDGAALQHAAIAAGRGAQSCGELAGELGARQHLHRLRRQRGAETVVPFSAFSHFTTGTTPVSVNHTGTSVSTSIAFNLPEGVSIGTALDAIDKKMSEIHMPVSIRGGTYGTATPVPAKQQQCAVDAAGGAGRRSMWCWACSTRATASR